MIYVLVLYTYDYFEFTQVISASLDREKLVEMATEYDLVVNDVEHKIVAEIEKAHYQILEFKEQHVHPRTSPTHESSKP